jgi:hypothetical protein
MNGASVVARGEIFAAILSYEAECLLCRVGGWPRVRYGVVPYEFSTEH